MKEIILNNFGWMGLVVFVLLFSLLKYTDVEETKWMDVLVYFVGLSIIIGLFHTFDVIGKWILK